MIKNLRIKNFKGISELNVTDLSRVNLIGGRNNVGKTSLLEALFLLHDRGNPNMFISLLGFRGMQSIELTTSAMWSPIFANYDMESDIEISFDTDNGERNELIFRLNKNFFKKEISTKSITPFGQQKQFITNINPIPSIALDIIYSFSDLTKKSRKPQKIQKPQISHLCIDSDSLNMQMDFSLKDFKSTTTVFMQATARNNPQEDAERFGKLDIVGKQNEIVEFIKKSIEPRLISLSSIPFSNQSVLHAEIEGIGRKIPVSYMGDGIARLISIILTISTTENGYIFIAF